MMIIHATMMAAALTMAPAETPLCEFGDLMVGRWSGDASLIEHAPEDGDREKVAARLTYRWAVPGVVLEGEWKRGEISGKWLLVWDPVDKVIKQMGGRSDGNVWKGVIVKKDKVWIGETEGILGDGAKVVGRFVTVFQEGGKRAVWEGEFSINGEKQDPVRDVYEKEGKKDVRSQPADSESEPDVPKKALKALNFFVGKWESETFLDGEKIGGGRGDRKWTPGKHCIQMTGSGTEEGANRHSAGISGWDAKGEQLVENWHATDGLHAVIRYPLVGMKADVWEGNFTVTFGDGGSYDGTCSLKIEDNGFTWTAHWEQDGEKKVRKSIARRIKKKRG